MPLLYRYLLTFLILFISINQSQGYPGGTPLSDNNYYIHKTPEYILIFDHQYLPQIQVIHEKVQFYFNHVKKYQKRKLLEPVVFIFLSEKSQTSNALASLFPYFQTVYYPSGLAGIYKMASPFWLDTIATHELTHIYQLSHSKFPDFFQKLLKSPHGVFSKIFLNVFPNQTLPRFILEGDAVLNESMIGKGGRLYSGFARAFVFSQIKKYQSSPFKLANRLINETIYPHGGREKYLHGGYFSLMLMNKFSYQSLLKFFKSNHGTLTTFRTSFFHNPSLIRSFKITFDELVQMYLLYYRRQASLQQSSPLEPLFQGASCFPFNRAGNKLFFMTTDNKSKSFIYTYNTKTKRWTRKNTSLLPGKIFKIGDSYYSRASHPNSVHSEVYSLFAENAFPYKYFNSKYVLDIRGKSFLYIDSSQNITGFKLYLNEEFYDYTHSNALFDADKNIYYFKQNDSIRTLYKNKTPLFSYHGFYGYLTDVNRQGKVYFIASTPFGSSLFKYDNNLKQVVRVTSSDTITWAKKINSDSFMACEVTPEGFDYKIIPAESRAEHPAFYTYQFGHSYLPGEPQIPRPEDSPPQFDKITPQLDDEDLELEEETWNVQNNSQNRKIASQIAKKLPYKKYSPLSQIKYSSIRQSLLFYPIHPTRFQYHMELIFTDYLQKNTIYLRYVNVNFRNMIFSASYQNRVYRLIWELGYDLGILQKINLTNQSDFITGGIPIFADFLYFLQTSHLNHIGFLNFKFPLLRKGYWSSFIELKNNLIYMKSSSYSVKSSVERNIMVSHIEQPQVLVGRWKVNWSLNYARKFPLAYLPHRLWKTNVFVDYLRGLNVPSQTKVRKDDLKWGIHSQWITHIGHQFYIAPYLGYVKSLHSRNVYMVMQPESLFFNQFQTHSSHFLPSNYRINLSRPTPFMTQEATLASLSLTKPIYAPVLTPYILSLLYLVPFVTTNYVILNNFAVHQQKNSSPKSSAHFLEWTAGLEMQFLLDYKKPLNIGVSIGQRTFIPDWIVSSNYYPLLNFYLKSDF